MEWSLGGCLAALGLLVLAWAAVRVVEWVWWSPRRLERALRAQGLRGNPYRVLYGDIKDDARLSKEVRSRPISPVSHRIIPRAVPGLHRTISQHGKFSFSWLGPIPIVTITDPELIREILSNKFGHFAKQKIGPIGRLLATGLASYEGEQWARHRRILNPAFHVEKLKRMLPAFSLCCGELISRWGSLLEPTGSCELDIWPELQSFTGDVISRTAFGSSFAEGRRIFQLQSEQAKLLIQAIQTVSVRIPGYRFLPTPENIRRKEIDAEVRALLRVIIEKREKVMKMGDVGDDLLGLLMESNSKQFEEQGNSKNISVAMTTEEVIEECKLFYFAGQETTSVLLTWTMILLSMYPSWQIRAREEVLQAFGKNTPDMDGLSHLKIVTMIIYEVLRLYSPVVFLNRRTYKTMKLGNITFPPEIILSLSLIFIHHDPEFWGEDTEEFNPERFAEGVSKATKNQLTFFPFGWGPRICIGQTFAMLEAKAVRELIQRSGNSCRSVCAYRVGDSCFPAFASAGKFLSVLQIPMSDVTDGMVEMHAPSLSALTVLDISCCLKITFKGIEALGKHCKSLVQLRRNMPPEADHSQQGGLNVKVEEEEAISVANTMPRLQHLELAYARFTDHGLNAIITKCELLRLLDIRGCWNVKFRGDLLQRCVLIPDFSDPWEDDTTYVIESDGALSDDDNFSELSDGALSDEDEFNENGGYFFDGDTSESESEVD